MNKAKSMSVPEFLSKGAQAELKSRYADALLKVWNEHLITDRMTKFCLGETAYFVPISGGKRIINITKPRIKKDFWFGYSDCGQGMSYDECNKTMDNVHKNLVSYFMNENLEGINKMIDDLEYLIKHNNQTTDTFNHGWTAWTGIHYTMDDPNTVIYSFTEIPWYAEFEDGNQHWLVKDKEKLTVEDLKNYLAAMKQVREDFTKRLNAYVKRYGTSKMSVDRYWVDR